MEVEQKAETAENWIDYFLNKENNTPIEMPKGELLQWQNWWDNLKAGSITMPPNTTMNAITNGYAETYTPSSPIPMEIKAEKPIIKKKKSETSASGLIW